MARKRYSPEQIIRHLRQVEVLSSQGRSVSEIYTDIGITEQMGYLIIYVLIMAVSLLQGLIGSGSGVLE